MCLSGGVIHLHALLDHGLFKQADQWDAATSAGLDEGCVGPPEEAGEGSIRAPMNGEKHWAV